MQKGGLRLKYEWINSEILYSLLQEDPTKTIISGREPLSEHQLLQICKLSDQWQKELGQALFPTELIRSLEASAFGGAAILLELDPNLSALPIEACLLPTDPPIPLALHPMLRAARFVQSTRPPVEKQSNAVLIACSNPDNGSYAHLPRAKQEAEAVHRALQSPECSELEPAILLNATPFSLQRSIEERKPCAFHFVGHGDSKASGQCLVLEGARSGEHLTIYADELAGWLRGVGTQLVVLSGCHTAGPDSLASALVKEGIRCAIGMRKEVQDTAAYLFARAFYAAIAQNCPVDEATYQGRFAVSGTPEAWSAAALFTCDPDLRLAKSANETPIHNLPNDEFAFIGREKELSEVCRLIESDSTKLINITGFGGIGKTRLARRACFEKLPDFKDGVFMVDCEALSGEDELFAVVASTLQLNCDPSAGAVATAIGARKILLLLDCFENLADKARSLPELKAAPNLKILVTSRTTLGNSLETEYQLGPFLSKRSRGGSDAELLFVSTAQRLFPQNKLDKQKRKVRQLVELLERVPLAIILAAAQLRYMTVDELTAQVERRRLQILRNPRPDHLRHSSLQYVVGESFALLQEEDRELAIQLSVFRGGFFLESAEAVVRESNLVERIGRLRENSILSVTFMGPRTRYKMLDTIREYVDLTYPDSVTEEARARHASEFLRVARAIRVSHDTGSVKEANAGLWLEAGNLRNAIEYGSLRGAKELKGFASALARLFYDLGLRADFEFLALAALPSAQSDRDYPLLIELTGLLGSYKRRQGDNAGAIEYWQRRAEICGECGEIEKKADALLDLTDLLVTEGRNEEAHRTLDEFESIRSSVVDQGLVVNALLLKSKLLKNEGKIRAALAETENALQIMNGLPSGPHQYYVWITSAAVFREGGKAAEGIALCKTMALRAIEEGRKHYAGMALLEMGRCLMVLGQLSPAAECVGLVTLLPRSVSTRLLERARELAAELETDGVEVVSHTFSQEEWVDKVGQFVRKY